jgi:hypothetical protein
MSRRNIQINYVSWNAEISDYEHRECFTPTKQQIRDEACKAIMESYSLSGLKRDYNIHPVVRAIKKIKANEKL